MTDSNLPAEQVPTQPARPTITSAKSPRIESLVIRSWPKIVLMLPTLFASIVCFIIMGIAGPVNPETQFGSIHYVGLAFLIIMGINLTMLLYDLSPKGFILVALLIAVLLLLIALINPGTGGTSLWTRIGKVMSVRVIANAAFYFIFSLILLFNLGIAWVITRFNYWKVEHNEIIIHKGFMHEQERHPTPQARFKLVIEDVVEYAILGSGKIIFYFADDNSHHELPTVLFVHRKAKQLDELLGRLAVTT
jgi:hypothetical protein